VGDAVLVGVGVDEGELLGDSVGVVVDVARGVPVGAAVGDGGTLGDAMGDGVSLGEAVAVGFGRVVPVGVGLSAAAVGVAVASARDGVGVFVAAPVAVGVAVCPPPFPAHAARLSPSATNSGHRLQILSMPLSSADAGIGARDYSSENAAEKSVAAAELLRRASSYSGTARTVVNVRTPRTSAGLYPSTTEEP
jgi:hypothetical protein